jgi:hypothetical protein
VSAQIFGSILGAEGIFECAGSEGGEGRGVGFDADANVNGFKLEHGCRSMVSTLVEDGILAVEGRAGGTRLGGFGVAFVEFAGEWQ